MIDEERLKEYQEIKILAKKYKDLEAEIRRDICDELLKNKTIGTHKFELGEFKFKAQKKVTYSLDNDLLSALWDSLSNEEKECVTYKPHFSSSRYKKLSDHHIIDEIITVKPAMPTFDFIDED